MPDLERVIEAFAAWLTSYGETSHDFQTFYAGPVGRRAKALYYRHRLLGTVAVAPMVFCEACIPSVRRFFWKKQRFPIADAHYAMAFAARYRATGNQSDYARAIHFLEELLQSRCPGSAHSGWGYPFDWEGIAGTIKQGTPLITTLPYVYEAFRAVHELDRDPRWLDVMLSIAQHALLDYRNIDTGEGAASCTYTPTAGDAGMVVNASAYRAFLLTQAAEDFGQAAYRNGAEGNLRFVLATQHSDGSWPYSADGKRPFVDHFHTCFVLKALAKIETIAPRRDVADALERGVEYYVSHLFDDERLPRPFAKAPRLIVYRRELYDYAECVNLSTLLQGRFPQLDDLGRLAVNDLLRRWQKSDGSFRSRQLFFGWDNVPMHRWAQAQTFRSLCLRFRCAERHALAHSNPKGLRSLAN